MSWSNPYCNTSHFAGPKHGGGRIQITYVDRGTYAEVTRLNLEAEARKLDTLTLKNAQPGGVFTSTHMALRKTVDEVKAIGEAWAKGDYSAAHLPEGGLQ